MTRCQVIPLSAKRCCKTRGCKLAVHVDDCCELDSQLNFDINAGAGALIRPVGRCHFASSASAEGAPPLRTGFYKLQLC